MIARWSAESWSKVAMRPNDSLRRVTESPLQELLRVDRTMDGAIGFEIFEASEDHARGRFEVEDRVRQPMGLVHGGAYAAAGESLASAATYLAVRSDGMLAMGLSNHTSFLRPVFEGTVHAEARRRHRGRTTWVWEVEFTDGEGRLCALTRVPPARLGAESAEEVLQLTLPLCPARGRQRGKVGARVRLSRARAEVGARGAPWSRSGS